MPVYPWHRYIHLLGTMPDKALAKKVGCSPGAVSRQRGKRGIPRFAPPSPPAPPKVKRWREKWAHAIPLLGTKPDTVLAEELGCHIDTIRSLRARLGIPAHPRNRNSLQPVEWHKLLGTMTDADVAARVGVSRQWVHLVRRRLGIPSWQERRRRGR